MSTKKHEKNGTVVTVNLVVENDDQQDDLDAFFRLFPDFELISYRLHDGKHEWLLMEGEQIVGLSNVPLAAVRYEGGHVIKVGERVMEKIRPFLRRVETIMHFEGGVYNFELKSGLWLLGAPMLVDSGVFFDAIQERDKARKQEVA